MRTKNEKNTARLKELLILIVVFALVGCRSMPPVEAAAADATPQSVTVADSHQHVAEQAPKRIAAAIGDRNPLLQHHLQVMAARADVELFRGNQARLLIDGPETYDAMFSAIAAARDHINLEAYIFDNDEVGKKLQEILLRKQQEGVQVNLIYDGIGSVGTAHELFDQLRAGGVRVYEFNPPRIDKALAINNRDHRKLLIVDGRIAFTGGINISSVYSKGSASARRGPVATQPPASDGSKDSGWRDTQIEVRGPAVAALQKIFFETWNQQSEEARAPQPGLTPNYFPPLNEAGDKLLRVIASTPDEKQNPIYLDLVSAIREARQSVHLTMAYFSPDQQTLDALKSAARRGVDVAIVLPGFSDLWLIFAAGRSHYTDLLQAGVKIYERHDALLHAKTAVIDGVWSTVGSSNMDMRSFLHNNEVNVVVLGSDFGDKMETMFDRDVGEAEVVTLAQWRQRPFFQRCQETIARLLAYWL